MENNKVLAGKANVRAMGTDVGEDGAGVRPPAPRKAAPFWSDGGGGAPCGGLLAALPGGPTLAAGVGAPGGDWAPVQLLHPRASLCSPQGCRVLPRGWVTCACSLPAFRHPMPAAAVRDGHLVTPRQPTCGPQLHSASGLWRRPEPPPALVAGRWSLVERKQQQGPAVPGGLVPLSPTGWPTEALI